MDLDDRQYPLTPDEVYRYSPNMWYNEGSGATRVVRTEKIIIGYDKGRPKYEYRNIKDMDVRQQIINLRELFLRNRRQGTTSALKHVMKPDSTLLSGNHNSGMKIILDEYRGTTVKVPKVVSWGAIPRINYNTPYYKPYLSEAEEPSGPLLVDNHFMLEMLDDLDRKLSDDDRKIRDLEERLANIPYWNIPRTKTHTVNVEVDGIKVDLSSMIKA